MLRVARIRDPTGRYYLADLASELSPDTPGRGDLGDAGNLGTGASAGRWLGTGAERLGLSGRVEAAALTAALSGRHPTQGHQLRTRESAVRAYDLTFAAPKSASVLFALGSPGAASAVRDAHEEAVEAAIAYVARHAAAVRRTEPGSREPGRRGPGDRPPGGRDPGEREVGPVDGLVAASFTHHVSRALDPHLHSHVVVANLVHGDDGRWRAVDGRGLYAHAQAAGALYDAVLRHGVSARLGLEWSQKPSLGWELSVVDPVLVGALSSRRAEILADLDRHARRADRSIGHVSRDTGMGGDGAAGVAGMRATPSRRARAVAWAATRDPKTTGLSASELRTRWAGVARDVHSSVEPVPEGLTRRAARAEIDEHRFATAVYEAGPRGVARRDVVRAWAVALPTGAAASSIARCVDALCDWGTAVGVAEPVRAPARVVPPPHVLRALGPRPAAPGQLSVWLSAASSITRYRARWEVRDPSRVLGSETRSELAAMPARRFDDHLSTVREIDEALSSLGRRHDRDRLLDRQRDRQLERDLDGPTGLVLDGR